MWRHEVGSGEAWVRCMRVIEVSEEIWGGESDEKEKEEVEKRHEDLTRGGM